MGYTEEDGTFNSGETEEMIAYIQDEIMSMEGHPRFFALGKLLMLVIHLLTIIQEQIKPSLNALWRYGIWTRVLFLKKSQQRDG